MSNFKEHKRCIKRSTSRELFIHKVCQEKKKMLKIFETLSLIVTIGREYEKNLKIRSCWQSGLCS